MRGSISRPKPSKRVASLKIPHELKYRSVFANEMIAICILDADQELILEVNDAFARIYGYSKAELEGKLKVTDITAEPDATREALRRASEGGSVFVPLRYHRKKDGTVFPVELTASAFQLGGHTLVTLLTHDITERKAAEQALQQTRRDLEKAQAVGKVGSWISDIHGGGKLSWSAECCRVFGLTESTFDGTVDTFYKLVHPEDRAAVGAAADDALLGKRPYEIEHRIVRPDGSIRWVREQAQVERDPAGKPLRMVGVVQDITDRRKLEEQLRHAQKMEAVGTLAGGVAHDFNNILTAILMQLSVLRLNPSLNDEARKAVEDLEQGANRAANLTRQLLLFSRQSVMQTRLLDINVLVENLLKMLGRVLGEHIHLEWKPGPGICAVDGDSGMLEQVIMNLCVNARDAMPKGGRLAISTQLLNLTRADCSRNEQARPGQFVRLTVADTGCGMDEQILGRIFEPFFTTKDVGKGTGLGLATVHGIVQQHRGWVEVESKAGLGSTFRVYLPALEATAGTSPAPAMPEIRGGTETILLVEDEENLRTLVGHCLRQQGYSVLEGSTGAQALSIWEQQEGCIDLVLTDMVMPGGMTGLELAERLRERKRDVKIILTSGYSTELMHEGSIQNNQVVFLPKPYEIRHLAGKVRECLEARTPSQPA